MGHGLRAGPAASATLASPWGVSKPGVVDGHHVEGLHLAGAEVGGQHVEPLPGLVGLGQVAQQVEVADQPGAVDGQRHQHDHRHQQGDRSGRPTTLPAQACHTPRSPMCLGLRGQKA